jgi:DNA-binding transcriptional ArsR family regulator
MTKRLQNSSADAKVSRMANNSAALSSIFYALADPTRRAVVQRLGRGPATVSELAEPFGIALPSFMKHVSRKSGRVRTCTLERKNLAAAERWFDEQREVWTSRYRNLDNLLERLSGEDHET